MRNRGSTPPLTQTTIGMNIERAYEECNQRARICGAFERGDTRCNEPVLLLLAGETGWTDVILATS